MKILVIFECLGSSFEQELTERMNAVLQEKAESQQSLALLRKEHEEFKRQAQVTYISDDFFETQSVTFRCPFSNSTFIKA